MSLNGLITRSTPRWLAMAAATLALTVHGGCYDREELLKQAHSAVLTATLAEIDLGKFVTTLPRDPESGVFTTVNLHLYGTVTRANLPAVEKQLKGDNFKLRHGILVALRQATRDELAEPSFAILRARILTTVNQIFTDAPVKEIGFYRITLR